MQNDLWGDAALFLSPNGASSFLSKLAARPGYAGGTIQPLSRDNDRGWVAIFRLKSYSGWYPVSNRLVELVLAE